MNEQIERYRDYINMLLCGHIHSVLCFSKAGFGKTFTTIKLLKEKKVVYGYNSGVTTAVALYKLLYDHRNSVLILDDIETIFQDDRIINLLKSALWDVDGKRRVTYKTSSNVLAEYPETFTYNGKIIILANEINGKHDESYKALMSRCLKYELVYTLEELKKISKIMVASRTDITQIQKMQIYDILDQKISHVHDFNFRLLDRLVEFVKYDSVKAENLFLNSLDVDEEKNILIDVIKKYKEVNEQISNFKELTGQSRMTFFRKKKKLKQDGVI